VIEELDVQGHRGARGLKPENTLPAFETALDLGVSTLELDLHYTVDGQVVVWHDATIDREKCGLSAGAPAGIPDPDDVLVPDRDRLIAGLDRARLQWYRCDRNPSSEDYPDQSPDPTALAGDDYRIVTLAELFDFVASYAVSPEKTGSQQAAAATVAFNIETKRKPDEPGTIGDGFDGREAGPFELAILAEIEERNLTDRVVIQSFDHRSLWAVHAENPGILLAALSVRDSVDAADLAGRGASIWSPNREAVDRDSLEAAHDAGLEVIPWTVNDRADMIGLIELGVDGLITDRPDILLDLLAERAAQAGS
jgi:glycerophosphoryl diester phosphodiesterase